MCSNLLRHIFVLCADFRGVRRFGLRGDMRMCFQNTIVAGPTAQETMRSIADITTLPGRSSPLGGGWE